MEKDAEEKKETAVRGRGRPAGALNKGKGKKSIVNKTLNVIKYAKRTLNPKLAAKAFAMATLHFNKLQLDRLRCEFVLYGYVLILSIPMFDLHTIFRVHQGNKLPGQSEDHDPRCSFAETPGRDSNPHFLRSRSPICPGPNPTNKNRASR